MKQALGYVLVIGAVVGAALAFTRLADRKGYGLNPGSTAPGFRLPTLGGPEVDLASMRGRVVLVNFWATWCPPCIEELPSLEHLYQTLGPEGLVVLGVSGDEDEAALRQFVADRKVTFPILRDPGGRVAESAYRTTGYPETFLVDPSGVLREKYIGPVDWDTPEAIAHFRGLLASLKTSPTR